MSDHEALKPFVRAMVERTQPVSAMDVLGELATRLQQVHAFPQLLPLAGQVLQEVLDEVVQVKNIKDNEKIKAKAGAK